MITIGKPYITTEQDTAYTLALEHLYGTYISSSSGHDVDQIEVGLTVPPQHYEGFICDCCSTETLRYINSDVVPRTEKLELLADDEDAQKYLLVCFNTGKQEKSCGRCYGCMKTMIPLDIIGKLDRFEAIFDLEKYEQEREEVFESLILYSRRPEASSARETVQQILQLTDRYQSTPGELFKSVYERMQSVSQGQAF